MIFSPLWLDARIAEADDYTTGNQLLKFNLRVGYVFALEEGQEGFPVNLVKAVILDDISEKLDELYKEHNHGLTKA